MIRVKKATEKDIILLSEMGIQTYKETHEKDIKSPEDLKRYLENTYSIDAITQSLRQPNNRFYIIYVDEEPAGYAKIMLNAESTYVDIVNPSKLDKIYILEKYIPLKIGQVLFDYLMDEAKKLKIGAYWLYVYIENHRAIRFYEKNDFTDIGRHDFMVNGTPYENIVFYKKIDG